MSEPTLEKMIEELRPMLALEGASFDFKMPSLLREVPSYTSDHTEVSGENGIAKLRGHPAPNF